VATEAPREAPRVRPGRAALAGPPALVESQALVESPALVEPLALVELPALAGPGAVLEVAGLLALEQAAPPASVVRPLAARVESLTAVRPALPAPGALLSMRERMPPTAVARAWT
jgi:hypothetical protein